MRTKPVVGAWYQQVQPFNPWRPPIVKVSQVTSRNYVTVQGHEYGVEMRTLSDFWNAWQPLEESTLRWLDQGCSLEPWMVPEAVMKPHPEGPLHYYGSTLAVITDVLGGLVFWSWEGSCLGRDMHMLPAKHVRGHFLEPLTIWDQLTEA